MLLLASACGGEDRATAANVIPFELDPVERQAEPTGEELAPAGTPPCTSAGVVVDGPSETDHLPMPPQIGAVVVTIQAAGTGGCALERWPAVAVDGANLPDTSGADDREPLLLQGRRQVIGFVHLPTRCDSRADLSIRLADGTAAQYSAPAPGCGEGMSPDDVVSGWMTWNEDPENTPFDALTLELEDLPKSIEGRLLRVTLVLGNPSDEDVPLDPCPTYHFGFGESGTVVSIDSRFNCDEAPSAVPAGSELRFAIELPIPEDEVPDGFVGSVGASLEDDDRERASDSSGEISVRGQQRVGTLEPQASSESDEGHRADPARLALRLVRVRR